MTFPDRRIAIMALTALFIAGMCIAVYCARRIILIFILAIFFAHLIDPLVKFLQRCSLFFKNLRGPAVVGVYLALLFVIFLVAYSFAPWRGQEYRGWGGRSAGHAGPAFDRRYRRRPQRGVWLERAARNPF